MKHDAIVIGGGPAGIISAVTAKRDHPDKNVLLIKSIGDGVIPCGIPYIFKTLEDPKCDEMGNAPLEKNSIDLKVDEVTGIDTGKKTVSTRGGETIGYDKLVIATGSNPLAPPIGGIDKKGIHTIKKQLSYLQSLKEEVKKAKSIVIVGGGFIGVEFADELALLKQENPELLITLVELMPEILSTFDKEFSALAHEALKQKGVSIITGVKVTEFNGDEHVKSVSLSDGQKLDADVVILGMGARPNSALAENAGLEIGEKKGIVVDEYQRTSNRDIYAAGDCAQKADLVTGKPNNIMLASTATYEARIAGHNLFGLVKDGSPMKNKGAIATYSTQIGDVVLGSAGLTEDMATKQEIDIVTSTAEAADKHPNRMPGANNVKVKLVFKKETGTIIGGQVSGGHSAGEIVNIIGIAVHEKMTCEQIGLLQLATHPKLTAAPTVYPVITAAQAALQKMKND